MRFVQFAELLPRYGVPFSKSTIWRKQRAGKFPAWTKLGPKHNAIPDSVVTAYIEVLAAGYSEVEATQVAEKVRRSFTELDVR